LIFLSISVIILASFVSLKGQFEAQR